MNTKLCNIIELLSKYQFSLTSETELQSQIKEILESNNIPFEKEYNLDDKNRPDFFLEGIALEVKIKGSAKSIYRQCERYCEFDAVSNLILVTNRSMGFPETLNDKPCYLIHLGQSWL